MKKPPEKMLLQIEATIEKVETMSNDSLRLKVDTQENISNEVIAKLMATRHKLGWFTFSVAQQIEPNVISNLPEIQKTDEGKSPSEILRGRLYVYWSQKINKGNFESWRIGEMDRIGRAYLEKLN